MVDADGVTTTEGVTAGFTVMVVALEVTVVGDAQAAVEVMLQVTTSPCARAALEYVLLLVPVLTPLICHW
jgi:hypothetical protein